MAEKAPKFDLVRAAEAAVLGLERETCAQRHTRAIAGAGEIAVFKTITRNPYTPTRWFTFVHKEDPEHPDNIAVTDYYQTSRGDGLQDALADAEKILAPVFGATVSKLAEPLPTVHIEERVPKPRDPLTLAA